MAPLLDDARAAGFTLIELLVVLGILGLVFAMALPQLQNAREGAELRAAVRDITAGLREAHSRAIASAQTGAFIVDTKHNAFRVGASATWRHLPAAIRPSLFNPDDEKLADDVGDIRFFPDGSSTGGSIRLALRNARYDLQVDWLTGRVDLRTDTGAAGGGLLPH